MTCIVGLVHNGAIYMGGDSAATSGTDVKIRRDPKVFFVDKKRFLIGFTSSFRMGQLLRFSFKPTLQMKAQSDYEYMCTDFINRVRKCFTEGGYMGKDRSDSEREEGGNFLVGYKGVLYEVDIDFQVIIGEDTYCSVGSGEDYAHGSLFTTEKLRMSPKKRIIAALETATYFSTEVKPPFMIERMDAPRKPLK